LKVEKISQVIVIEHNHQAKLLIKRGLETFLNPMDTTKYYPNISSAIEDMKVMLDAGLDVDLIITELFYTDTINIFSLLHYLENIQSLWNTPLVIYTNETSKAMHKRISKEIKYIPFRFVTKVNDEMVLANACKELLKFRKENRHYLSLLTTVNAFKSIGKASLLVPTIKKIDDYTYKYPEAIPKGRKDYLKGVVFFSLWQELNKEAEVHVKTLENASRSSSNYSNATKKLEKLSKQLDVLMDNTETYFLNALEYIPDNWEILQGLYTFYLDRADLKEAKKYLLMLIKAFPNQSRYYHRLGKINEMEGDFTSAIKNYFSAARNAWDEGLAGYDPNDVMEIINSSLHASKKVLQEAGATEISADKYEAGSQLHASMQIMQQANAQVRLALAHMVKKNPQEPDLYNKLGITYRRVGNIRMATEMYAKAIKLAPNNPRIRINYAVALASTQTWDFAGREIKEAKALDSQGEDAKFIDILVDVINEKDSKRLNKILT